LLDFLDFAGSLNSHGLHWYTAGIGFFLAEKKAENI